MITSLRRARNYEAQRIHSWRSAATETAVVRAASARNQERRRGMSSLNMADRHSLEKLFGMEGGYVLNFSDRTFGEFIFEAVAVDIHSERYATDGTSKARKLRTFWKLESDYLV